MEPAFWHKRWAQQQIGFHQVQINPYLQKYWPALGLAPDTRVLVPLCGKSLDLAWLAGQGHRVLGVELSRQAVQAFFAEHELAPEVEQQGAFELWRSGAVEVLCGDIFELRAEHVAGCVGLYDRAALIALPASMRERYMALLNALLPTTRGLLVTLDYDQSLIDGPPFAVGGGEVRAGFAGWQLEELEAPEIIADSPRFQQAGVGSLVERVYRLQR